MHARWLVVITSGLDDLPQGGRRYIHLFRKLLTFRQPDNADVPFRGRTSTVCLKGEVVAALPFKTFTDPELQQAELRLQPILYSIRNI